MLLFPLLPRHPPTMSFRTSMTRSESGTGEPKSGSLLVHPLNQNQASARMPGVNIFSELERAVLPNGEMVVINGKFAYCVWLNKISMDLHKWSFVSRRADNWSNPQEKKGRERLFVVVVGARACLTAFFSLPFCSPPRPYFCLFGLSGHRFWTFLVNDKQRPNRPCVCLTVMVRKRW